MIQKLEEERLWRWEGSRVALIFKGFVHELCSGSMRAGSVQGGLLTATTCRQRR